MRISTLRLIAWKSGVGASEAKSCEMKRIFPNRMLKNYFEGSS